MTLPVYPLTLSVTRQEWECPNSALTVTDAGGGDTIALNSPLHLIVWNVRTGLPLGQFEIQATGKRLNDAVTLTSGANGPVYRLDPADGCLCNHRDSAQRSLHDACDGSIAVNVG